MEDLFKVESWILVVGTPGFAMLRRACWSWLGVAYKRTKHGFAITIN
jgi:hypothetical protein